jgi:hypothetical protein
MQVLFLSSRMASAKEAHLMERTWKLVRPKFTWYDESRLAVCIGFSLQRAAGGCLKKAGVSIGDSRDELGRHRFIPIPVGEAVKSENLTRREKYKFFWNFAHFPVKKVCLHT